TLFRSQALRLSFGVSIRRLKEATLNPSTPASCANAAKEKAQRRHCIILNSFFIICLFSAYFQPSFCFKFGFRSISAKGMGYRYFRSAHSRCPGFQITSPDAPFDNCSCPAALEGVTFTKAIPGVEDVGR